MARKKTKLNDNNLAIAYYRYSSHSQNEASIEQQRELAHEWADAHGLKIVREYEDAAISGTKEDRPGFQLMLSEVAKIRPNTLIAWKTDRLGRDKYVLAMAKKTIRDAGCEIHLLAENIPTDTAEGILIEGLMEALAEYYSRNLSVHIQRGMDFNAEHANFNGHKVFGFKTEKVDRKRKYVIDPDTAPFVQLMFAKYAEGEPMQSICDEFNEAGLRTSRGNPFGVKTMHRMLKNRAYIGEYRHGEFVVPGGMPALVDEETFDRAQKRLAENKRKGSQRARGMDEDGAPRYWLTGKLYCGECGETMQGVSGTSKTGRTYYYYYCSAQRKKLCTKKKVKKDWIEDLVTDVLRYIIDDSENLMSLAVDAAVYYKEHYKETGYLEGLEAKRKEVEKGIANLMKAIEGGALSDTLIERLNQLEAQKASLNDAIQAENVKVSLCEDEHSIKAYFEKFLHADFDNPETRDKILEYFVDKIYLYDEKLVVTSWYSEDKTEITWDMLKGADGDPFVKGEAAEFDCFPLGSTNGNLVELPSTCGSSTIGNSTRTESPSMTILDTKAVTRLATSRDAITDSSQNSTCSRVKTGALRSRLSSLFSSCALSSPSARTFSASASLAPSFMAMSSALDSSTFMDAILLRMSAPSSISSASASSWAPSTRSATMSATPGSESAPATAS